MKTNFYQYRSFEWIYLLKMKNGYIANVQIFDIFQKHVFTSTVSDNYCKLTDVMHDGKLDMLLITKDFPKKYRITSDISKLGILSQKLHEKILKCIENLTLNSCTLFNCPITKDIMTDPVTDNHGHTYEKKAIEKYMSMNKTEVCPLNRQPITSLTSNILVKRIVNNLKTGKLLPPCSYKEAVIDEHGRTYEKAVITKLMQTAEGCTVDERRINYIVPNRIIQDFCMEKRIVPNFFLFKEKNSKRAECEIEKASQYEKAGKYKRALECYSEAFKHTKSWRDYLSIPPLFETIRTAAQASIAYLYLAKYQLDAGDVEEAIQTLEIFQKKDHSFVAIDQVLIDLYYFMGRPQQVIDKRIKLIAKKSFKEAILSYKRLLDNDPLLLSSYFELAKLLASPVEKAHILCKGMLEAFVGKSYKEASRFVLEARHHYQDSILNELAFLMVSRELSATEKIYQNILCIAQKLQEKRLWEEMLLAYKVVPKSKYTIADQMIIYRTHKALGQKKKAIAWLTQIANSTDRLDLLPDPMENKILMSLKDNALGSKEVDFSCSGISDEEWNVLSNKICGDILLLNLSNNAIHGQTALQLPKELQSLDLSKNQIGVDGAKELAKHLPATLQSLNLSKNRIEIDGAIALSKHLPALRSLDLSSNAISHITLKFTDIKTLTKHLPATLQSSKLTANKIKHLAITILAHNLPATLQSLNLSSNHMEDTIIKSFVKNLSATLQSLNLSHNEISGEGIQSFVKHLPVKSLNLSHNIMEFRGIATIAPHLPATLQSLNLGWNDIGYEGVEVLAQYLPKTLQSLNLSGNNIGDEGVKALVQHLPATLQSLKLNCNNIGDEGVEALARHSPATLQSLHLSWNNIGDEGLKALAWHLHATLQSLDISKNKIRYEKFKTFTQHSPDTFQPLSLDIVLS